MLYLSKVKFAVFDFDDTLCLHDKMKSKDWDREEYDAKILSRGYDPWENSKPFTALKPAIDYFKEKEVDMYLMSWVASSFHATRKIEWVQEKFGVWMQDACTGSVEDKLRILKALAKHRGTAVEEVLFVDDNVEVLKDAAALGFLVATPAFLAESIYSGDWCK